MPDKKWEVERKFKDFYDLRHEILRLNPGTLMPPVHDFTIDKNYQPECINQTKEMLQDFLDAVLRHPLFGCCELVYHFLHYPNENKKSDEFEKKVKSYSSMPVPLKIEEMKTVTGEAKIALTKETETYVETASASAAKLKDLYLE